MNFWDHATCLTTHLSDTSFDRQMSDKWAVGKKNIPQGRQSTCPTCQISDNSIEFERKCLFTSVCLPIKTVVYQ